MAKREKGQKRALLWTAPAVQDLAQEIIDAHHTRLQGPTLKYCFCQKSPRVNGRVEWGRVEVIGGKAAALVAGLPNSDEVIEDDGRFFLITVCQGAWNAADLSQKKALVDSLLCSAGVTEKGNLTVWKPDVVEFAQIVARHGIWRPQLKAAAKQFAKWSTGVLPGLDDADPASSLPALVLQLGEALGLDAETIARALEPGGRDHLRRGLSLAFETNAAINALERFRRLDPRDPESDTDADIEAEADELPEMDETGPTQFDEMRRMEAENDAAEARLLESGTPEADEDRSSEPTSGQETPPARVIAAVAFDDETGPVSASIPSIKSTQSTEPDPDLRTLDSPSVSIHDLSMQGGVSASLFPSLSCFACGHKGVAIARLDHQRQPMGYCQLCADRAALWHQCPRCLMPRCLPCPPSLAGSHLAHVARYELCQLTPVLRGPNTAGFGQTQPQLDAAPILDAPAAAASSPRRKRRSTPAESAVTA